MKIKKLSLNNFGPYFGIHEIVLDVESEKPVIVIIGGNRFGKTTVFDAINWALYGKSYENYLLNKRQKNISDYINASALQNCINNCEKFSVWATLDFDHEGRDYSIHQEFEVISKNNSKNPEMVSLPTSLIEFSTDGDALPIKYSDLFLNEILPSNVRDYFFIDGERIEQLSLPGSSSEIRDGIYRVIDLELIQRGIEHLRKAADKFRNRAQNISTGKQKDIEENYNQKCDQLDSEKEKIDNYKNEIVVLESHRDILQDRLRKFPDTMKIQTDIDHLRSELDNLVNQRKKIVSNLKLQLSISCLILANNDLEKLGNHLNEKRNKGEIPSSISKSLLKDLIEMHQCICGTRFSQNDEIELRLRKRLDEEEEKSLQGNELVNLYYEIIKSKEKISAATSNLRNTDTELDIQNLKIEECRKRIKDLEIKLGEIPKEDISRLVEELDNKNKSIRTNTQLLIQSKSFINDLEKEIESLRNSRDKLSINSKKINSLMKREYLANKAIDELEKIFETFVVSTRDEVQSITALEFRKFLPSASTLNIKISEEFQYDARDINNTNALPQLSAGEKQALSLAYITAISKVSEKEPPLMIDMPFGRFEIEIQKNIAKRLPDLSSQLILLLLPGTEWNDDIQQLLIEKTSIIYEIDFNKQTRQSKINRIY